MDFGLIALLLTVAHITLSYIAPKTKSKWDDRALTAVKAAQTVMPAVKPDAQKPAPASAPVAGFGVARDHRSKN